MKPQNVTCLASRNKGFVTWEGYIKLAPPVVRGKSVHSPLNKYVPYFWWVNVLHSVFCCCFFFIFIRLQESSIHIIECPNVLQNPPMHVVHTSSVTGYPISNTITQFNGVMFLHVYLRVVNRKIVSLSKMALCSSPRKVEFHMHRDLYLPLDISHN